MSMSEEKMTRAEALAAAGTDYAKWQKAWKMLPEGIEQWEWDHYQNMDPKWIKPDLRAKVEKAMGWKPEDIAAAHAVAEQVGEALAPKGHVPEENLAGYRRLRALDRQFKSLGNTLSNRGEHDDASTCWALATKYGNMANELREDIPKADEPSAGSQTAPQT